MHWTKWVENEVLADFLLVVKDRELVLDILNQTYLDGERRGWKERIEYSKRFGN